MSLFPRLDAEWSIFSRLPASNDRFHRWCAEETALRPFDGVGDVVRYVQTPGHPSASDDVLRCLAERSATDCVAARTLLQAVLYGLVPIAARFRPAAGGDREEIAAIVVATAYDRIRTYPIDRRPRRIAANVLLDTRQAVSRHLCRRRVHEQPLSDLGFEAEVSPPSATEEVIDLVGQAVRKRFVSPADARIILLTRVLDVPAEDLAIEHGCLPHSLRRRRLRAETALAEAVA